MSEDEKLKLLATNGMLVKRPIVVAGEKIFVGFKESEWEGFLPQPKSAPNLKGS